MVGKTVKQEDIDDAWKRALRGEKPVRTPWRVWLVIITIALAVGVGVYLLPVWPK